MNEIDDNDEEDLACEEPRFSPDTLSTLEALVYNFETWIIPGAFGRTTLEGIVIAKREAELALQTLRGILSRTERR